MLTNNTVFNLVDFDDTLIVVAADAVDLQVQIELLGSKSFANPEHHDSTAPVLLDGEPFALRGFSCRNKDISHALPAFNGGYGAVRVSSLDGNMFVAFATIRSSTTIEQFVDRHPASGPTCGNAFRIPLLFNPGQRLKIAVTCLDQDQFVSIGEPAQDNPPVHILADHTYLWDSRAVGVDVSRSSAIDVISQGTGRLAVSAVILRQEMPRKVRVYPLPLARPA